ncbi:hypothetical protein T440DRAFT_490368 [Plenodomus tracheiphilus IPT5]|uniref:Uncharacterized protein n=1 Tax=Plenodomus tracheiphilus IPT5 TaxID=1408161 RepID=A0A6A7B5W0_9PLEO|nr:hypothetical protein T440DRAFT_490368 [Plenodomus tracheiphilus IPT5]
MPPARGKKSMSKAERQARANAVYDEFQVLAEQEEAPAPLTAIEIKRLMNPDSYNQYLYTIRLWDRCFIESDAWKNTNEGLLYKDVELEYQDDDDYRGFLIKVRLRNRKGHREYKKHAPVNVLPEEPTIRSACPVTYFIAMALADGVFCEGNTFNDLAAQRVPAGALTYRFKYRPEALERPIMRSTNPDGSLSESRVLTYDTFNCALKGLGQRAGYKENLSAYCFRRAFARTIFNTGTAQQQRILMNHKGDQSMGFYTSGIVGVDTQAMIRGKSQRTQFLERHISMLGNRRLDAPQPPGSRLIEVARAPAPADDNVFDVVTASGLYSLKKQARHKAYWKKREDFFEDRCKDAVSSDSVVPHRSPSRYLRAVWKFDPDREHIVNSIFHDGNVNHRVEIPLAAFVPSMVKVANPRRQQYHYRCAAPLPDNRCVVCDKQLDCLPVTTRFTQFHDVFTLHKHMKEHLAEQDSPLSVCPLHPRCIDSLDSEDAFWEHAQSVHGTPPFGACRQTGKRKTVDGSAEPVQHQRLCVRQGD